MRFRWDLFAQYWRQHVHKRWYKNSLSTHWPVRLIVPADVTSLLIRARKTDALEDAQATSAPGELVLRGLQKSDKKRWQELQSKQRDWLAPWESTLPPGWTRVVQSFADMVRYQRKQGRRGEAFVFVVELSGVFVGMITVFPILRGPSQNAAIGYWISREAAGRGITTAAMARVCDFCFFEQALHRVEVNIIPRNYSSLRVVEKLGFRLEGQRERYLHIAGQWEDHLSFALTAEEMWPDGALERLKRMQSELQQSKGEQQK